MKRFLLLYRSTLGKKALVAITGAILLGFLVGHVVGNLKVFLPDPSPGVPDIDVYAEFLRTMGEPLVPATAILWLVRIVLVAALLIHLDCVISLARRNRKARPVGYRRQVYVESGRSARWMLYSGGLILIFVVLHILHFTTGQLDPSRFEHGKVYANLYRAFAHWYYVAFYVVSLAAISAHLYHGIWSLFQTLGIDNPDRNRGLRTFAGITALVLFLGFASIPLAFFLELVAPPPGSNVVTVAPVGGEAKR